MILGPAQAQTRFRDRERGLCPLCVGERNTDNGLYRGPDCPVKALEHREADMRGNSPGEERNLGERETASEEDKLGVDILEEEEVFEESLQAVHFRLEERLGEGC